MILRAPIDRMQRVVSTSWSFFGSHVVGSDYLKTGAAYDTIPVTASSRYKRLVVIEHGA
jgi:hypothetical protein